MFQNKENVTAKVGGIKKMAKEAKSLAVFVVKPLPIRVMVLIFALPVLLSVSLFKLGIGHGQ